MQRVMELIEWVDRLGYDEAWIGEHHSGGYETISSPEIFNAAAERTRRIKFGLGVVSLPFHNPLIVASRDDPKFLSYPVAGMSGCEKFDGISAG